MRMKIMKLNVHRKYKIQLSMRTYKNSQSLQTTMMAIIRTWSEGEKYRYSFFVASVLARTGKFDQRKNIFMEIIIIYDFLPLPRKGSHVKSDSTHKIVKKQPLTHIPDICALIFISYYQSPNHEAIASSTSSLIWGLKEFTEVVEFPTRPWSSLSCFETTQSIQVSIQVAPFSQFIPTASCNGIPPLSRW